MNEIAFKATTFGYALLKESKRYYRGLKVASPFHQVVLRNLGMKRDIIILRDGTFVKFDDPQKQSALYWGIVNMKYVKGELSFQDNNICLTLPKYPLKVFLTSMNDIFIVGEVFVDEVYRPLASETLKNKVVVDIGTYIGMTPIYFALFGAKVFGYEVLPMHYDFTNLNSKINNLMNKVIVHNLAVGGIRRNISVPSRSSSFSYSIYKKTSLNRDFVNVDVVTFKDIMDMNGIDKIHLLKIDCEGCEYEFFKYINIKDLINVNEIILEFHRSPKPIVEKLRKAGFCTITLKQTIRAYNKRFRG